MNSRIIDRKTVVFCSFLILLFVLAAYSHLGVPLHRDEGIYGYVAQQIFEGKAPLTTVVDNKTPLTYYIFAIPLKLAGINSIQGIRLTAVILWCILILLTAIIARRLFPDSKYAGHYAGIFMFFSALSVSAISYFLSTELIGMALILASLAFVPESAQKRHYVLISGFLFCAAVLCRPTYVLFVFIYLPFVISFSDENGAKLNAVARNLLYFFAGGVISGGLMLLILGINNLPLIYETLYYYNGVVSRSGPGGYDWTAVSGLFRNLFFENPLFVALFVLGIIFIIMNNDKKESTLKIFFINWIIVGIAVIVMTYQYFGRNLIQVIPMMALSGAYALDKLFSFTWKRNFALVLLSFIILSGFAYTSLKLYPYYFEYSPAEFSEKVQGKPFVESVSLGSYIAWNSSPDDFIFNWGAQWELYFYSHRRAASPHISINIFLRAAYAMLNNNLPPDLYTVFQRHQNELIMDLNQKKPRFIIVTAPFFDYNLSDYFLPKEVRKIIEKDYIYDSGFKCDYFEVYKRKAGVM